MSASKAMKAVRALAIVAGLAGAGFAWRARPLPARAATIERGDVRAEAAGTGTLESDDEISIAFTTSGRIASLAVDEGDRVQAGQVLGTLDVSEVTKQVAVARAGESLAGASEGRAKVDVARARIGRDAAAKDYERIAALVRAEAASGTQLDDAKEKLDRAEVDLKAASSSVYQASSGSVVARESSAAQARRLDDGKVVSPVDGVVVKRARAVGDVVGSGVTVLVVASTKKVRVRAWIDETALASLREGAEARVLVRSEQSRSLRGRVERIGLSADRQTHEVLVDVELLERPARVAFGQRADVFVTLAERKAVTRAPLGFCDLAAASCWVDRSGRIARANVSFGLLGADFVEITSGLAAGDVVLAPPTDGSTLTLGRRVGRVGS